MSDLKPCPCGKTPDKLYVSEGSTFRWRYVTGHCCGEWMIEVRVTTMRKMSDEEIYAECVEGWNAASRAAAPELLEALEAFVCNSSVQVNQPEECERAEAAIAKARGRG